MMNGKHKERMVQEHLMETVSGKPLYNYGQSVTLEKADHRQRTFTLESPTSTWNVNRLARAERMIGEKCVWKFNRLTPVIDIF